MFFYREISWAIWETNCPFMHYKSTGSLAMPNWLLVSTMTCPEFHSILSSLHKQQQNNAMNDLIQNTVCLFWIIMLCSHEETKKGPLLLFHTESWAGAWEQAYTACSVPPVFLKISSVTLNSATNHPLWRQQQWSNKSTQPFAYRKYLCVCSFQLKHMQALVSASFNKQNFTWNLHSIDFY